MSSADSPLIRLDFANFEQPLPTGTIGQDLGSAALGNRYYFDDDFSSHRPSFCETEAHRGTVLVAMDAMGDITVADGEEKRIATFGLGGCTAVAIAAELPDGSRRGYVQHYSPLNGSFSADMLADATSRLAAEGATSTRVVVMTPGEWTLDPADKWGMKPADDVLAGLLTATAQARLGVDADVQVYPYSEMQTSDGYGQGTLMIEFRPGSDTTILAEQIPIHPEPQS